MSRPTAEMLATCRVVCISVLLKIFYNSLLHRQKEFKYTRDTSLMGIGVNSKNKKFDGLLKEVANNNNFHDHLNNIIYFFNQL
jgi:hypothetical protein